MTKFEKIEALGLKVLTGELFGAGNPNENYIKASDLEALLEKGVRVYGHEEYRCIDKLQAGSDTHTGFLIDYKPIPKPKPVTKEELRRAIESDVKYSTHAQMEMVKILKRILDAGVE